jgi:methyl-accepting chemotaxis protein
MKMKFKARMLLPILGIIVIGVAVLQYLSYRIAAHAMEEEIFDSTEAEASMAARTLDDWINTELKVLEDWTESDVAYTEAAANEHAEYIKEVNQQFEHKQKNFNFFEALYLTDDTGMVIAASDKSMVGISLAERNYFKSVMKGDDAVSPTVLSKFTGKPIFAVAVPVKLNGKVVGMLGGAIKIEYLEELIINDIKVGESGYAYIIDDTGLVVAHPRRELVQKANFTEYKFGQYMVENKNGHYRYWWELDKAFKWQGFRQSEKTGWIIAVTAPLDELLHELQSIKTYASVGGVILVLIVGIVIFLLVGNAAKVLKAVGAVLDQVALGDLSRNVDEKLLKRSDEFGELCVSLDSTMKAQQAKAAAIQAVAAGDLTREVVLASEKDSVGMALQQMNAAIKELIARTKKTCEQQLAGDMDARNSLEGLQGEFATLAGGVNEALESIIVPISEGMEILNEYANGDLSREMRELPGKQMVLTDSLRKVRNNLLSIISTLNQLTGDALCGRLNERADEEGFQGQYKELMRNINALVDSLVKIIDGMPSPAFTVGPEMSILYINKAAAKVTGKTAEECVGTKCHSHFKTPQCQTGKCATGRCMREGHQVTEETDAHPNGMDLDIKYTGMPLHDNQGNVVGGLEFITDLTDIKKAQRLVAKRAEFQAKEVEKLADNLALLANGDFNFEARVESGDEDTVNERKAFENINSSLENARARLDGVLSEVREAVNQVHSGVAQISDASQSLSQGATEQASSLEEITSSMSQIASQTKTNAENAGQANNVSSNVRTAAESGNSKMEQMMTAMNDINDSSQQIAKIIKVIDDIAFQTNMLALNAAVEAARAGRHGKGFAVVADEVRNLAGRSAKAAKETADLIDSSGSKVEHGLSVAEQTLESFKEIVDGIVKTTDLVGEIAAASNEQAQGMAQINQGLSQIDSVTQQNTANAEETAAAAEELRSQGDELKHQISAFKLTTGERTLTAGTKKQKPAALKPATLSKPKTSTQKEWGGGGTKGSATEHDVINLDDKEFGKY